MSVFKRLRARSSKGGGIRAEREKGRKKRRREGCRGLVLGAWM